MRVLMYSSLFGYTFGTRVPAASLELKTSDAFVVLFSSIFAGVLA